MEQVVRAFAPARPHLRAVPAATAGEPLDELHGGKSAPRRCLERLFGLATDPHPRAAGVTSEEEITEQLERLPESWRVLHGVTVGPRRGEVDQLVVGPGGAFTLHAMRGRGPTVVYERAVLQNGHETDVVTRSLNLASQLQTSLSESWGRRALVRPLLVVGTEPEARGRPTEFTVVASRDLWGWFSRLPSALTSREVDELERLVRTPRTAPVPVGQTIRGYRP